MNNKIVFIISHKYYTEFPPSHIKYYVDNIQKIYPNAFTIIVDNNSDNLEEDIIIQFKDYKNLVILINNTECKYELGAYKVGIQYIVENNFYNLEYCVFTQDSFVLKNYFDFDNLKHNNIFACSLLSQPSDVDRNNQELFENILKSINLYDYLDQITFCCCNSFILHGTKVKDFLEITKNIIIKDKYGSNCSERVLSRILYELNNHKIAYLHNLSHILDNNKYDFFDESAIYSKLDDDIYFCKYIGIFKRQQISQTDGLNNKKDLNL